MILNSTKPLRLAVSRGVRLSGEFSFVKLHTYCNRLRQATASAEVKLGEIISIQTKQVQPRYIDNKVV